MKNEEDVKPEIIIEDEQAKMTTSEIPQTLTLEETLCVTSGIIDAIINTFDKNNLVRMQYLQDNESLQHGRHFKVVIEQVRGVRRPVFEFDTRMAANAVGVFLREKYHLQYLRYHKNEKTGERKFGVSMSIRNAVNGVARVNQYIKKGLWKKESYPIALEENGKVEIKQVTVHHQLFEKMERMEQFFTSIQGLGYTEKPAHQPGGDSNYFVDAIDYEKAVYVKILFCSLVVVTKVVGHLQEEAFTDFDFGPWEICVILDKEKYKKPSFSSVWPVIFD